MERPDMLDETKATEFELILEGLISAVKGLCEGTVRRIIILDSIGRVQIISVKERLELMETKAADAKLLLDEAVMHIAANEILQALEKLTVAETVTREMIAEMRMEYVRQTEEVSFNKTMGYSRNRHVMWYELKEKYRHV